jgi:alcohol dehydrogenase
VKIQAAVLRQPGFASSFAESRPLSIEELDLDAPQSGEVLVKIRAAGICHSDLVAVSGERSLPVPMVIGHEVAGVVAAVGPGVKDLAVGDHVVSNFVSSCGSCPTCLKGSPAMCEPATRSNRAGVLRSGDTRLRLDGEPVFHHSGVAGFADHAVIACEGLIRTDPDLPFEYAALFGCAVVTGAGAVLNTGRLRPGQSVAVVGLGGVGFSAIMAARAGGAEQVIAIDVNPKKLAKAKEFGATLVFNATEADVADKVHAATNGGVDLTIEAAGAPAAIETAFATTRPGGTTVVAGMPGPAATFTLPHLALAAQERVVRGSYMGSADARSDVPKYIRLFQNGDLPVDRLLTHRVELGDINEAMDRLAQGHSIRQVIVFPE